jgi:hypothetical protein
LLLIAAAVFGLRSAILKTRVNYRPRLWTDDAFKQVRRMDFHRLAEADKYRDGGLALPAFDVVDVLAGDRRFRRKFFLRQSSRDPGFS